MGGGIPVSAVLLAPRVKGIVSTGERWPSVSYHLVPTPTFQLHSRVPKQGKGTSVSLIQRGPCRSCFLIFFFFKATRGQKESNVTFAGVQLAGTQFLSGRKSQCTFCPALEPWGCYHLSPWLFLPSRWKSRGANLAQKKVGSYEEHKSRGASLVWETAPGIGIQAAQRCGHHSRGHPLSEQRGPCEYCQLPATACLLHTRPPTKPSTCVSLLCPYDVPGRYQVYLCF